MKKRILAVLLVLVTVLGMLPVFTMAAEAEQVVYLSVYNDGSFVTTNSGTVMAYVPVPMSELEKIDLIDYGADSYLYDADNDGDNEITALHLFIYAQEKLYGGSWSEVSAGGNPGSLYFGGGLFGFTENMTYYHNGTYPMDAKLSVDWGFDVGATADHIVLEPGDYVDLSGYSDWGFYSDPEAGFRYFVSNDNAVTHSYTANKGEAVSVTLATAKQTWENGSTLTMVMDPEASNTVCYSQTLLDADAKTVTTNENGQASITFDTVGTWYVWSMGDSVSSPAYAEVNVLWKNTSEVSSDWHNFRNSYYNMAVVNANTPKSAQTTVLKWATLLGTGWSNNPSVQIIVDNALIVMSNKTIYKLDLQTGETLLSGEMSAAPNFGYTPPSYADGLIFCPLANGTVEAFDAKTLDSVWIYNDALKGQSLSPILYNDGYVYTGFWNGENKDANYVCLDVSDGSLVWSMTVTGGFYWAGSVVIGDTLIVGTDDGESGATGNSHLLSINKKDGTIISDLTLTGCGDQRSSIAYNEANGRVYFSTKNGYLGSAAVNAETGELSELKTVKQVESQSTSTPVVYGDKVFYTAGSGVVTGSGGSGNFIVADADTLEQLYAMPLLAYPQGSALVSDAYYAEEGMLYFYSTYNGKPGGLTLIKVDPSKDTAEGAEVIEIYDAKGYEQYCITSPICGADGTIYYKNDSGYIMAVGTNNAYLAGMSADVGRQNGSFSASDAAIEWLVPIGTETVTLDPTACDSGTATVEGGNTVTLTDGTASTTVTVTKGEENRTYAVSIREISSDTSLGVLKVNEANSYSSAALPLTPELTSGTYYYGVYNVGSSRSFDNVWPVATDSNAAVKVYAVENIKSGKYDEQTGEISITATNSGYNRYAIYFEDDTKPMAIRIEVTAENGDIANYCLVLSKKAAAEAGAALLAKLENTAAAEPVAALIDAIGTVTLYSADDIDAARDAYNALTDEAKNYVTNYEALAAAEAELERLKDENTAVPVDIYVTIADKGDVVVAQQKVTVTDVNDNGFFDVDDALYAAHEKFYTGGAAAGYASYESQWGLSISMLWGDTSYCYGYWLNNASCWSLEDVVADGNHLMAFVYQDSMYWSDAYTRFGSYDYTTEAETALTVKLEKAGYDANWNTVFAAHAGATVTVYDADMKAVTATVTDNGDGTYSVTVKDAGSYYLVATDSDPLAVPAVCAVTVTAKAADTTNPGGSTSGGDTTAPGTEANTPGTDPTTPTTPSTDPTAPSTEATTPGNTTSGGSTGSDKTGDESNIIVYGCLMVISAMALAILLIADRKRKLCK